MKRQKALLFAGAMLLGSLAGCGFSGSPASLKAEAAEQAEGLSMAEVTLDESRPNTKTSGERYEEFVLAINNPPSNILPAGTNEQGKQELQNEIYEPLAVRYAHDGEELWGVIAKSWDDVDTLHTKVELYDYVKDTAGNPIKASDVVFSYNLAIDSGLTTGFDVLEKVEALDEYTVQFTWKEELGVTDFSNIMTQCCIVSEAGYDEEAFITSPIGTGPYVLSDYTAGVSYELEANEDYWQTDESVICPTQRRNVQKIRYDVISDSAQQLIAFENGSIDSIALHVEDLSAFQEGGEYYGVYPLYYNPATNDTGILANCSESSICSDINFRLAMYYAIDASAICEALGNGQYNAPVSDSFPGLYDYNEDWANYDSYYNHYDVELAKEYLAKTAYNGEEIVCLIDSDPDRDNCAVIIQGFLGAIGIRMKIDSYEHAIASTYFDDPTLWDISIDGCGAEGSITLLWDRRYNSANFASGCTKGFADDPQLQELLAKASKVSTHSQETVDAFNQYLTDQAYFYGIYSGTNISSTTPDIGWFALNYKNAIIPGGCEFYLD